MFADLGAQGLGRHEEGAGKSVSGFFVIDFRRDIQNHVTEFVSGRESLALSPVFLIDDDHRRDALVLPAHTGCETVNVVKMHRKNLDAAFLKQFDEIWDRVDTKSPMTADAVCRLFRLRHVMEHRPRGIARQISRDSGQTENFLHCEIALQQIEHLGLDLRLFALASQPLSPVVDGFKRDFAVAGQISGGNA